MPRPEPMSVINADANYRTWWQENWPYVIGIGIIVVVAVALVIVGIYFAGLAAASEAVAAITTIVAPIVEKLAEAA